MTTQTTPKEWKGYTLEEIRFRKMLAMAKADIGKSFFTQQVAQLTRTQGTPVSILGKLSGALSYFDYAMLAYRSARTIFRHFKRK